MPGRNPTLPCSRFLPRNLRRSAATVAALLLVPVWLHAQAATGKIEGRVRDTAGRLLSDAQIYILGTAYFALSDPRGHYFINNIPAGSVSIRAALIGHRPVEIRDLRVPAGHTTTQDFSLQSQPLQLREITVLAAENPLVPRDEVTSKQRVSGEFARELPQDRLDDLLSLQPGVVASDVVGGQGAPLQGLSIRGGRLDEAAIYVDGVPVSPGYRGYGFGLPGTAISVGTNAIEEGSVITGSPSAEFGNAQSGIISIVTRTGGTRLGGALSYETDEPFGVNRGLGFNRVEGSLGGPLAGRLTFFVSGVLEGQKAELVGFDAHRAPVFVQAGIDTMVAVPSDTTPIADTTYVNVYEFAVSRGRCDEFSGSSNEGIQTNYGFACRGIRTPGTASSTYQLQSKLNYTYGEGSRITLSHLASQTQWRSFDHGNLYNRAALYGERKWSGVTTLTWAQTLSRTAERALTLEASIGYQTDRGIRSPLALEGERASREPFGGFTLRPLRFLFDFDNFPLDQELVDNYRFNRTGTRRTPYDLENTDQYRLKDLYRNNAYGLTGWSESGGPDGDFRLYRENRYLARAILDGQVDRYNRVKLGGEFIRYSIDRYQSELTSVGGVIGDVYLEDPLRWNLFVENRLDLGDVVLVGGLRYDSYSSRAERPYQLDTIPSSNTFGQYVFGFDPAFQGEFQGRPLTVTRPDRGHGYVSPHLQVSFPVTERTNVRLSYAHHVEAPDFTVVLFGLNIAGIGANLDFGKTIAYEFGVRHAFSDNTVLDLAAYNRDNLSNASLRTIPLFDPVTRAQSGLTQRFTNADFGNSRGVDIRLDQRVGGWFNGTIGYSYQSANSTGTDPFTNQFRGLAGLLATAGDVGPPPQAILPTAFDRPHALTGALSLTVPAGWREGTTLGAIAEQVGLFATLRFTSGTPYTRCDPKAGNEDVISGDNFCPAGGSSVHGARLPSVKQFDLRVTKGFDLGRLELTAYLDARNLFNFRNLHQVFAATGDEVSKLDHEGRWASDSADYAAEAQASGVRQEDGSMDLRFGGAVASGCAGWLTGGELPAAPNCVYLIRAEERYGDGDHVFTLAEQRRASNANYAVDQGVHLFTGPPRRLRVGLELSF
jgi:hypothetical protein